MSKRIAFPKVFWASNFIELFERWAWYGFYNALALYLTGSRDTGALGFSAGEKGIIMGTGSMLLYFLPIITGAIADKVGYKKVLSLSFALYIITYWMVGHFQSFTMVFTSFILLAIAGALFKPIISAMISKTTNPSNSSIGFGIFYMMINIGGFIGPFIAGVLYKLDWNYVFLMSMIIIGVNYPILFLFFKEPDRDKLKTGDSFSKTIGTAFKNIGITLVNFKYVLFLIIMIGFWTAFNQLYYSFPVFLDDWADTTNVFNLIESIWPWLADTIGSDGTITAVTMVSLDAFFIIVFQILISWLVMRFKPLNAMISGIFVLGIGLFLMFSTQNGLYIVLGILIFAIGEMSSSPKFTEYVGSIAPADKKALYMGTSFLPIAAAHQLAGLLSGDIYDKISGKMYLLQLEIENRGLSIPEISESFTKNKYWDKACELTGMDSSQLTNFLWDNYQPNRIWILYSGIAIGSVIALILYDKFILKSIKAS